MKSGFLVFFSVVGLAFGLSAEPLPTPQQLLEKHLQALGGTSVVSSAVPIRIKGALEIPSLKASAPMEYWIDGPTRFKALARYHHKFFGKVKVPFVGKFAFVCGADEQGGWGFDQDENPFLLEGDNLIPFRGLFEKFSPLVQTNYYQSVETLDAMEWEGKKTFRVLQLTPHGGHTYEFYDRETGLLAGSEFGYTQDRGAVTVRLLYEDYKKISGRLFPATIRVRVTEDSLLLRIHSVEVPSSKGDELKLPKEITTFRQKQKGKKGVEPIVTNLPSPETILARHAQAIGGPAAFAQLPAIKTTGEYLAPKDKLRGTFEQFRTAAGKSFLHLNIKNWGVYQFGCNGEHCWRIRPSDGVTVFDGPRKLQEKDRSNILYDLHLPSDFKYKRTLALTEFKKEPCHKVLLVRHSGESVVHYYRVSDGLLAGSIMIIDTPQELATEIAHFSDYQSFGPLRLPTRRAFYNRDYLQEMIVKSVDFAPVPPDRFEIPKEVESVLKKSGS